MFSRESHATLQADSTSTAVLILPDSPRVNGACKLLVHTSSALRLSTQYVRQYGRRYSIPGIHAWYVSYTRGIDYFRHIVLVVRSNVEPNATTNTFRYTR